jgi:hypothetical protein
LGKRGKFKTYYRNLTFEWLAEVKVIHIIKGPKGGRWKIDQTVRDRVIQELFNPSLNFGSGGTSQRTESSRTASQLSEDRDHVDPLPEVSQNPRKERLL